MEVDYQPGLYTFFTHIQYSQPVLKKLVCLKALQVDSDNWCLSQCFSDVSYAHFRVIMWFIKLSDSVHCVKTAPYNVRGDLIRIYHNLSKILH